MTLVFLLSNISHVFQDTRTSFRLVYQNKNLSFSELLELDNAATIHHRNLQVLVTECFKLKNIYLEK